MRQQGFTYIETLIVMGVISILFGFVIINMRGVQQKASLDSTVSTLVSDISTQQIKAMSDANKYGVYFEEGKYILFKGDSFSPLDTTNFTVMLDSSIRLSDIKLPNSTILFFQGRGEVMGYDNNNNSITITTDDGKIETLSINKYGVLSQ